MTRARSRLAFLAATAAYAVLAVVVQRDLVRQLGRAVYHQAMLGQDCLLHVWTIAWGQHALATAPCRLFDANIFFPETDTLLYSDHLLGLALLLSPLRLVTDDVLLVHNLATVAAPLLNALALYALAYDLTGRHGAAFIGGLLYGFAPFRLTMDRCQIQMLVAWWPPLMLLGGQRAIRDGSAWGALLAGVALAFQGLTGIYLTAFFLPFLVLAHLVWLRRWPVASHRGWRLLLVAEASALLVQVPFVQAYRSLQEHLGAQRPLLLNAIGSLQWITLAEHMPLASMTLLGLAACVLARRLPPRLRADLGLYLVVVLGALVLALGPAMALPPGFGSVWGPYALLMQLPGFSALRVPARMMHVMMLGAAVLAAGGVAALTSRRRGGGLAAVMLLLSGAVLVDTRVPSFELIPAPPPAKLDPVNPWLATQSGMRIVDLPSDPFGLSTAFAMYGSTLHWRPMLNGTSGILPPISPWMQARLPGFPDADVIADLRALGITHAVVDTKPLPPQVLARLDGAVADRRLKVRHRAGDSVVYSLRPSLRVRTVRPSGRRLDPATWTVTASTAARANRIVLGDDPAASWSSWSPLNDELRAEWYNPTPIVARWQRRLDAEPSRVTIDLGVEATVTGVSAAFGGSDPMALPLITLETSIDGQRWTPFPERLSPVPDVRALVDAPRTAPLGAVASDGVRARWLRFAGNPLDWHVSDLAVYAR
jgi:hypothetical protein